MLKLTAYEADELGFGGGDIRVRGRMPGVELLGGRTSSPRFGIAQTTEYELADLAGMVSVQTADAAPLMLRREIFRSADGAVLALRMTATNRSARPVQLDKMTALDCRGNESLFVGGTMETFRCLKLGRHKLDVPAVFRPSVVDDCYRDAGFQAHKLRAGLGVQGNTQDYYSMDKIFSEPVFFIKNDRDESLDGLGMCVLGQSRHLTSFVLSPDAERKSLRAFEISLEFDGMLLEPGKDVKSHWIVFYTARTEHDAIWRYAELLAAHRHILAPREKYTLYCSWYFYGREFYEADLKENLTLLKALNAPVDAFIIDNGWMDRFGDFNGNAKFPSGMAKIAELIDSAGFAPGLWTCPFLLMPDSKRFGAHPELAARNRAGEHAMFHYIEGDCHIVDPTHPYCEEYFHELYARLNGWGYRYHKMDFMRAPTVNDDMVFYDRRFNRASAYRKGHELLRAAIGPDRYFLSCGGIYDAGTLELADSVRTGSDSVGGWNHPLAGREGGSKIQVKQTMFRNYLNRFCNADPDSLMLRRRTEPFRKHTSPVHDILSDGRFTDDEAQTMVAKQYICGGNVNFSERMAELPEDRLKLLSAVIPPVTAPAKVLDYDQPDTPTLCLTQVEAGVTPYWTLTVFNWADRAVAREITLASLKLPVEQVALFEFFAQNFLGVIGPEGSIRLNLGPHGAACVRITPVKEGKALLVGTDCHMSMGGYELTDLREGVDGVTGHISSKWNFPVTLTIVKMEAGSVSSKTGTFENQSDFTLAFETGYPK